MFRGFLAKTASGMVLALGAALAQSGPTFEVASVKPATTPAEARAAGRNVGMKINGDRVDIGVASLEFLIETAYNVKRYQIVGPDWMIRERFDILAKLPEGAAKDQVPQMLQTLLAERFKLAVRREAKEQTVYALVVGKDGAKLKEAAPDAPKSDKPFANGFGGRSLLQVQESPDGPRTYAMLHGMMIFEAEKINMADLALTLMPYVEDTPVVDMTGLNGYYQVALNVPGPPNSGKLAARGGMGRGDGGSAGSTGEASDPGGAIFASVQKLGLRLERRKGPVERIVVEHLEKLPTEN